MATMSQGIETRPCAFCGKPMPARLNRCPFCREEVPEVKLSSARSGSTSTREGGPGIRRGLLWMLLGGVVYYFAAGYSHLNLPDFLHSVLVGYLSQFVFLAGLGMCVFGWYQRVRS